MASSRRLQNSVPIKIIISQSEPDAANAIEHVSNVAGPFAPKCHSSCAGSVELRFCIKKCLLGDDNLVAKSLKNDRKPSQ